MSIATAPRNILKIKSRSAFNFLFSGIRFVLQKVFGKKGIVRSVLYYPAIKDAHALADIINRICWYFPRSNLSEVTVHVAIEKNLAEISLHDLTPPGGQERCFDMARLIKLVPEGDIDFDQYDTLMLWSAGALFSWKLRFRWHKVEVVDPCFFSHVEAEAHRRIYSHTVGQSIKDEVLKQSKRNYGNLMERCASMRKGYVFATGPSIDRTFEHDVSDGFTVVCNSIVKSRKLLEHIKPDVLVFADPVFHFSPSMYAATFRRQMADAVRDFGCYVMIPDVAAYLMLAHHPELKEYLIGMPSTDGAYNFPTPDNFYVKKTDNIMSLFMLPIASAVADEIYIIGSDGRRPEDKYFWQHNQAVQFEDLMETAFKTHPSFFRDRLYRDYYAHHCQTLREIIEYGEGRGKKYVSLTPSHIPVLSERLSL